MSYSEGLKREIKAELKRKGLTYKNAGDQVGLSEGAVRNTLSGNRELLTVNAAKLLELLDLELTVNPKAPDPDNA